MTLATRETSALVLAAQAMQLREFGGMLVSSGMLPQSVRTPEAAVTIIVKGMELGLPPMAALNGITVIQGKPTVSPQLMLSLINRSGQLENIEIETGPQGATVTMKRRGRSPFTAKFGPAEAQAMGLHSKDNYKKQPGVMYQWRAVAACARVVFPDVIDGLYTPEEMGADVQVDEDGAMTVEVRQEEKAAPAAQEGQEDPALVAWVQKVGEMAVRVRKVAGDEAVAELLDLWQWRTSKDDAKGAYAALKTLGKNVAAAQQQPSPQITSDPAPISEELATTAQIQQLQAIARSAGASTSEDRALLWGHKLKQPAPIGTKELTEAQAAELLREFELTDADARKQLLSEAKREAAGRLM